MEIRNRVTDDMKAAMTARDQARLETLRLIRAEFLKAEKEGAGPPDSARQIAILQKMLKQRQESIEQFEQGGRAEMAEQERREAAVIQEYLPQSLGETEIRAAIDEILAAAGNPDSSQMGKIMGQVMAKLKASGKPFDGKAVNAMVKDRMGG